MLIGGFVCSDILWQVLIIITLGCEKFALYVWRLLGVVDIAQGRERLS